MAVPTPPLIFNGFELRGNSLLVVSKTTLEHRSWKERLFTLPWRPLKKEKHVTEWVGSNEVVRVGNVLYAHPDMIEKIKVQLSNKGVN